MLLGLIVAIFLILLAMTVAAPLIARSLRREREVEAVHRGNQYTRAIQLYYRKFGHYPGTLDQLANSNNIRFLRQKYTDPITGKNDWRTIPVGQNKTTVKGFFGQPLAGLPTAGVGSVAGMLSPGIGVGAAGASGATGASGAAGATGSTGPSAGGFGTSGFGSSGGSGSPSAFTGTSLPFMGVGLDAPGDSIVVVNEQTTYATWEFLYDPRVDQMKAQAAALNGAGLGSTPAGSLGQTPGVFGATTPTTGATGGATTPGATTPAAPPPNQP
jgi:type II secretory pathway pseudopilin PulG